MAVQQTKFGLLASEVAALTVRCLPQLCNSVCVPIRLA